MVMHLPGLPGISEKNKEKQAESVNKARAKADSEYNQRKEESGSKRFENYLAGNKKRREMQEMRHDHKKHPRG